MEFDDFDLDIRFDGGSVSERYSAGGPVHIKVTEITCQADCGREFDTLGAQCERHPERTALALECAGLPGTVGHTCPESCNPLLCAVREPPTAFEHTCEQTCAPQATCPANTCGLDCETDTCPDATCGCNTNETCNRDICEGGGQVTSPPCEDPSGAEDTCDACPAQTGGCGGADTDQCVKTDIQC